WRRSSASLWRTHGRVPAVAPTIDLDHAAPYPIGRMTVPAGTTTSPPTSRLAPRFQLREFRIGAPLWPLRIADAYRADGPGGRATLYVVHAAIAQHAGVRDHIVAGTRAAAALPEHRHLVRTLAAGLTGDILWIATEEIDGSLVRELMAKK